MRDTGADALKGARVKEVRVAPLAARRRVRYVALEVLLPVDRRVLEAVPACAKAIYIAERGRGEEEGKGTMGGRGGW